MNKINWYENIKISILNKYSTKEIVCYGMIAIFVCGAVLGYMAALDHVYHQLDDLIQSGRYLLFDGHVYQILPIEYPEIAIANNITGNGTYRPV